MNSIYRDIELSSFIKPSCGPGLCPKSLASSCEQDDPNEDKTIVESIFAALLIVKHLCSWCPFKVSLAISDQTCHLALSCTHSLLSEVFGHAKQKHSVTSTHLQAIFSPMHCDFSLNVLYKTDATDTYFTHT